MNPATTAALAASLAFVVQGGVLAGLLIRDRLWWPGWPLLRPLLAVVAADLVMLAGLTALMPSLRGSLSIDAAIGWRLGALMLLCVAGLGLYAVAGRLLGAFHLRELGRLGRPV